MSALVLCCQVLGLVYQTFSIPLQIDSIETSEEVSESSFEDNFITQPVDHFNLFDNRTWKMRYLVNKEFFKAGRPLFVEIGGEWSIDGTSLETGQLYLLAKKHRGMLVETEHRFYGKSLPFGTDFSFENMKFLQIEQALEDLARFVDKFKAMTPGLNNSKVVVHGCSYPGMLATWIRLKFPHLVDIAYASSAPLGVGLDYPEYYEIVNDVYANVSNNCITTISKGFNHTEQLMRSPRGRQVVRNALKDWNCGDINDMNSMEILSKMLLVMNVQSDPYKYEFISCGILARHSNSLDAFHRLANLIVLKSQNSSECRDETTEEEDRNNRAWNYQTCTEIGTFQTLSRSNSRHPFAQEFTLEESLEECVADFGTGVNEEVLLRGVDRVTRRYGGKRPTVTKVVTVQGTHDPWRHLAVLNDYNEEAPVITIDGSHCIDIYDDDNGRLRQVKAKIRNTISKWLKEISRVSV